MPLFWAAAAAIVGVGSAVVAGDASKKAARDAMSAEERMRADALAEFKDIKIPTLEELTYSINPFELEDLLKNPVQFDVSDLMRPDSAYNNITISPEVLAAQGKTLEDFGRVAEEGITAQEQADLNRGETRARTYERGQREAIIQQAQARGVGGSGFELATQLAAQQEGANRQARTGFDVQALAKNRALQALMNQGQLAERMRTQEYGEGANVARAKDSITAFNLQQQKDERLLNQQRDYQAALAKQKIATINEEDRRAIAARDSELRQYRSAKEMELAKAKGGIYADAARTVGAPIRAAGQADATMIAGIGSSISKGMNQYAGIEQDKLDKAGD